MTSDRHDGGQVPWLASKLIVLHRGNGRLAGERRVDVSGSDGAMLSLRARTAVVLATGTRAALPPVPGLDGVGPWTNREATETHTVPRRLLVLGGGAVGCEMAQCFRRLGSQEVTVLEGAQRLLAREEALAGDEVRVAFETEGIRVLLGAQLTSVRRDDLGAVFARLSDGSEVVGDH